MFIILCIMPGIYLSRSCTWKNIDFLCIAGSKEDNKHKHFKNKIMFLFLIAHHLLFYVNWYKLYTHSDVSNLANWAFWIISVSAYNFSKSILKSLISIFQFWMKFVVSWTKPKLMGLVGEIERVTPTSWNDRTNEGKINSRHFYESHHRLIIKSLFVCFSSLPSLSYGSFGQYVRVSTAG